MVYIGYGLTDKWSDGRSHTTGVSTQPSANAYLRPSRRYTVLRSKGIRSMAKRLACRSSSLEHFIVFFLLPIFLMHGLSMHVCSSPLLSHILLTSIHRCQSSLANFLSLTIYKFVVCYNCKIIESN